AVRSRPTRSFSSICFRTRPVSVMSGLRPFATSAREATRSAGEIDGISAPEEEGSLEVEQAAARSRSVQPRRGALELKVFSPGPMRAADAGRRLTREPRSATFAPRTTDA